MREVPESISGCSGRPRRGPRGFVHSDGEAVYYETHGRGEAIVFTHGMGGNHTVWYQQVPEFGREHCVITWDQRGFGRSSNDRDEGGPRTAVGDLKVVLDTLGIERAHLVGQSMGGWPTLGFGLAHPDRTISMVLGDSTAGIRTPAVDRMFEGFAQRGGAPAVSSDLVIGSHPALGARFREEDLARAFLYEQIGDMVGDPPRSAWSECTEVVYSAGELASLGISTLFVVGGEDPIFSPDVVQEAATMLPRSRVVTIPAAGHSPYYEAPRLWNDTVLRFLVDVAARG